MVGPETAVMTVEMIEASQLGTQAISAAIAISLTGLSTAIAEYGIGSAALGAAAENRDLFGMGLVLTAIPETIVIFGLIVALLILF